MRHAALTSIFLLLALAMGPVQPVSASVDAAPAQEVLQEQAAAQEHADDDHGPLPPAWLVLPFAALLIMIATGPLFFAHHWHHHYPKYSVVLGLFVGLYYIFVLDSPIAVEHAASEYLSFIALVASLFIAASGIFVSINAKGTPLNNVVLLFSASVIANIIATTGSAMLFIRSYMRLNKGRLKAYHIVFFIFLVANVGGALTPIGDPPLFLGFLRGVPFFWTFTHVWYIWLPATALILLVFYVLDSRNKAESPNAVPGQPIVSLEGSKSFFWVAIIIISVFIDPNVFPWVPDLHYLLGVPFGIREIIMFTVAFLAFKTADKTAMEKNEFNFEPIREVGWLFLGIFATMQPALQLISNFASQNADSLTVGLFYWGTGALSGILDNAPTYLNFLAASMGKFGMDVNDPASVNAFAESLNSAIYLQAISVAAVFFGAMSYIGNAPNFMVKAIAESNGVETPSFMGYIVRYSIPILLPVYFVIYIVFYSGWIL
ncbi:MAG: citrate transporter [Bacteroidetes bacterium CG12_big_fil_rev_8_21_14_0_65_60_17]|nr:MAG: citrate transporter [Bacteroidetes bacterium CG12_big_fil_rev_8_21_14_0_65_60_17]